jgi:hypothetical protein
MKLISYAYFRLGNKQNVVFRGRVCNVLSTNKQWQCLN